MFCKICGKELNEHAFACPNCGCLVNEGATKPVKVKAETSEKSTSFKVFLILSVSFVALSLLFSIGSIVFSYPFVYYYNSSYTSYSYGYLFTNGLAIPAFVAGICALGFGITAFVLGLKQQNDSMKMISVVNFIFAIAVCIIAVLAFGNCYEL